MEDDMSTLTKEIASTVSTVEHKDFPEWGTKKFNHNSEVGINGERYSTIGSGVNSKVICEEDFHLWKVKTFKAIAAVHS